MSRITVLLCALAALVVVWWLTISSRQTEALNHAKQAVVNLETANQASLDYMARRSEAYEDRTPPKESVSPEVHATNKQTIKNILAQRNTPLDDIQHFGYGAIAILTELYKESSSNSEKAKIASIFWRLGWKSQEIEETLMPDLDADDDYLKVQAQWGIAKSTVNSDVISKLLDNLENDPSPFVRDKAACALASDFIHISPAQKIQILRGLVEGLNSEITQVRASSILALKVRTGQTKGFVAGADIESRLQSIKTWGEWVDEYERSI